LTTLAPVPEAGGNLPPRLPPGVGATGYTVACRRAEESERADRLFDDPFASVFAATGSGTSAAIDFGQHSQQQIEDLIAFGAITEFAFAVRTRFFDDVLLAASGTCPQVVLLAAGLDARAFRLKWPAGTRVFELDLPAVLEFKEQVLESVDAEPTCVRTAAVADLAGDWKTALLDTGFDPAIATAWLAEGLMLYLSSEEAEALLSNVTELSSANSLLTFEHGAYADDLLLDRVVTTHAMRAAVSTWKGGLRVDPAAWLHARGWIATTHALADVGAGLGRDPPRHIAVDLVVATRQSC